MFYLYVRIDHEFRRGMNTGASYSKSTTPN